MTSRRLRLLALLLPLCAAGLALAAPEGLPPGAVARLGTTRFRQGERIVAIAYSPDGKSIAAAGGRRLVVWDAEAGMPRGGPWELREHPRALAFAPDGQTIACIVDLWGLDALDARTGKDVALGVSGTRLEAIAFSSDGKRIATAGPLEGLAVVDAGGGASRSKPWEDTAALCFGAGEGRAGSLYSVDRWGEVRVLTAGGATLPLVRRFARPEPQMRVASALSPAGVAVRTMPRADRMGLVLEVQDLESDRPPLRIDAPFRGEATLAISRDGRRIAGACWGDGVRVWDAESGALLCSFGVTLTATASSLYVADAHEIRALAFSPDGKRLAAGGDDATVRLFDLEARSEVAPPRGHPAGARLLSFSPDGARLATTSLQGEVLLWRPSAPSATPLVLEAGLGVGTGGKNTVKLCSFTGAGLLAADLDGHVVARAAAGDGERRASSLDLRAAGIEERIAAFGASPDGRRIALATPHGGIVLFDAASGKLERRIETGDRGWPGILHLAFSPDGALLAAGDSRSVIGLYDVATGGARGDLEGHAQDPSNLGGISALAFGPGGVTLASTAVDGTLLLWSVAERKVTARARAAPAKHFANDVAFSPDGRVVATAGGDGAVRLHDARTGAGVRALAGHAGQVLGVAFSPDGRTLASGGDDGTVLLWNVGGP